MFHRNYAKPYPIPQLVVYYNVFPKGPMSSVMSYAVSSKC